MEVGVMRLLMMNKLTLLAQVCVQLPLVCPTRGKLSIDCIDFLNQHFL